MNNQQNTNVFMKNETLKNMLLKISQDVKTNSSYSDFNNLLIEDKHQTNNFNNINSELNNENFTNDFFRERYKNLIPSRYVTPSNFLKNQNFDEKIPVKGYSNELEKEFNINIKEILIHKMSLDQIKLYSEKCTIQNWIKTYNELNPNKMMSVKNIYSEHPPDNFIFIEKLKNYFFQYCYNSSVGKFVLICEVQDVHIIDNLIILDVIDFQLKKIKLLVTQNDTAPNQEINDNLMIQSELQFRIKEIVILRNDHVKEIKSTLNEIVLQIANNYIKIVK